MLKPKTSECPKLLADLMEVCNALPSPYVWPADYEWPEKGEADWTVPARPIEARLVHPDILTAEKKHGFNVEFAVKHDLAWAVLLEDAFWQHAGHFSFVSHAEELFGHFLAKHDRAVRRKMDDSLAPYLVGLPTESTVSYGKLLTDRIARFRLPRILTDYIDMTVLPPSSVEMRWGRVNAATRWSQLWHAFYNLNEIANLTEDEGRRGIITQVSPNRGKFTSIYVDSQGVVRLLQDLFVQVITTVDVEAARVRTCKECKSFLWAKRFDQVCCSRKCTNAYNVRNYRKRSKLVHSGEEIQIAEK